MTGAEKKDARRTVYHAFATGAMQTLALLLFGVAHESLDPFGLLPSPGSMEHFDPMLLGADLGALGLWYIAAGAAVGAVVAVLAGRRLARLPQRLSTGQVLVYACALPYALLFILTYPFRGGWVVALAASGCFWAVPFAAGGALYGYLMARPRDEKTAGTS